MIEIIIDDSDPQKPIFVEIEDGNGKSLSVQQYGSEYRKDGFRVIRVD